MEFDFVRGNLVPSDLRRPLDVVGREARQRNTANVNKCMRFATKTSNRKLVAESSFVHLLLTVMKKGQVVGSAFSSWLTQT